MFEIRLDDEGMKEEADDSKDEKTKGEEEQKDLDPLNQTLSFQQGEDLKIRDWSEEMRREWSQRTPRTLLEALGNMGVHSGCDSVAEAEQDDELSGRKQWVDGPPNTLLNVLADAELTSSTLDSESADAEKDGAEEEEDSDVEMDEDRLEPRSDDDDTNFEESEDELREAVADSMKNLFVMEDSSSDEKESSEDREQVDGRAGGDSDPQQVCPAAADAAKPITILSPEPDEHDGQPEKSDGNTPRTTQPQTN